MRWKSISVLCVATIAALSPLHAEAQKLNRQTGASLQFTLSKFETVGGPLEPGAAFAATAARPKTVVRLLGDTLPRPGIVGGQVPGVKSGELLYAVKTADDLIVYCAFHDPQQPKRQRQCYLDLQKNGVFVASYVTNTYNAPAKAGMMGQWLGDLAGVPPVKYEPADPAAAPVESYSFKFLRWRGDRIVVNDFLGGEDAREPILCQVGEDKPCALRGVAIATFRRVGDKQVELVSFKPQTTKDVDTAAAAATPNG
jgi:hypothetical protein